MTIPQLSWLSHNTEYSLDDGVLCFWLGIDGAGMPPLHRLSERGPLQSGETDRGYRLDPRLITLLIGIQGESPIDMHSKRATLISIFQAKNEPDTLKWQLGSAVRHIDGFLIEGLRFNSQDEAGFLFQQEIVVIKCPDPRWYDPEMHTVTFNLGGGTDKFEVPYQVPYKIGVSTLDIDRNVVYAGGIRSYPTVRITGPITNPVITHNGTGFKLDFTGTTIAAGDWYEIDLGYAQNTIFDKAGANKLNDLSDDSDLVEFAIEASLAGGVNSINVTGSAISPATRIDINYYDMYAGI